LLKTISTRLKSTIRTSDTIARLGGDEFIIAIPIKGEDNIHEIIQRYMDTISEPLQLGKYFLRITASVGISRFPKDGSDASTLIKNADIALYKVKDSGRNHYMFYAHGMKQKTLQYMNLETDLNNALENKEFTMYYQPIINSQTLKIEGMEALLRWKHPKFGIIMPEKFINLAEVIGIICPVGEWVLKTACRQQREWQLQNLPPTMISVNLSTYQFREKDNIVDMVKRVIRETNIDPKYLELELTETALIRNTKNVRKALVALKKLGITITIDDFGTGYSNLSYLKQFPIDKIKIDKVFIQNLPKNLKDATIVDGIISMANRLDMKITIEGVETEEQLQHLHAEFGHIPYSIQGFYFSKPLEAIEATALLKKKDYSMGAPNSMHRKI
jgi:predicted signal transduction protein with EAL and GGDEF domain